MDSIFLDNTVAQWCWAAGAAVLLFLALEVLKNRLHRLINALAGRTKTRVDDLAAGLIEGTKWPVLAVLAIYGASFLLTVSPRATGFLQAAAVIAVLVQGALLGNALITVWVNRYRDKMLESDSASAMTAGVIGFVVRLVFFSIVLLVALDNLGVDVTTLIASLGIGGIAIALALQNVLSDLFACLSIAFDKPFVIGDFIIVGEQMGVVERVGLKTTRVRSLSGEQLVFANSDLLNSRIRNFKRMYERRVAFKFGVVYQTTHEQLAAIPKMVKDIITPIENTRFDRSHFFAYGDSSLDFETVYYVLGPDYNLYMDIQQRINLEIFKAFEENGISFAYPTRTLYIEGKTDAV